MAFGGDVHAEGGARRALQPGGLAAIAPVLKAADLAMVNLETAITERGTPENKQFRFRAPATFLTRLREAGIDVVTEANNHGRDYGAVGLEDSLAAKASGRLPVVGIGHNATEAFAPYRVTIKGVRVAIIGATNVIDGNLQASWTATDTHPGLASAYQLERFTAAVRAAHATSDLVVVYLHWGTELVTCPTERQRTMADALVAAGADVIVGSHAHRLLGAGRKGNAYVDYGLGNFVFAGSGGPGNTTGVLTLTVQNRRVIKQQWTPARISNGIPAPVKGASAIASAQASWARLRGCTDLTAA